MRGLPGMFAPVYQDLAREIERGVGHLVDVCHPRLLRLRGRLDPRRSRDCMCEAIGDPVDVLLDGHHHVADHGRAAGPVMVKRFGKPAMAIAEVGARSLGPRLPQVPGRRPADVDVEQGAGHGIEAGGEDDAVELVLGRRGPHTARVIASIGACGDRPG